MLYITTRSVTNQYTAHKALINDSASDGGKFVPFRFPQYTTQQINQLKSKSFFRIVAEVLDQFFSLRLCNDDFDFDLPAFHSVLQMSHRAVIAELWHNQTGSYQEFETYVRKRLANKAGVETCAADWTRIAIRIAVIFALYGEMLRLEWVNPDRTIDVSSCNDDLLTPIAALYCRNMGLPINVIICTCEKDNDIWDFIHKGTVNTAMMPEALQSGLERLIHTTLGAEEGLRFARCCGENKTYTVDEEKLSTMNAGLFCVVAGKERSGQVINSLFRMNTYIADNHTALAYGGLQDYRAKMGGNGFALLLSDNTPLRCLEDISAATGLEENKIESFL